MLLFQALEVAWLTCRMHAPLSSMRSRALHVQTMKAMQVAMRRGKLQTEDLVFLIRKDRKKHARVKELLIMYDELKRARKAFDAVDEDEGKGGGGEDGGGGAEKEAKEGKEEKPAKASKPKEKKSKKAAAAAAAAAAATAAAAPAPAPAAAAAASSSADT